MGVLGVWRCRLAPGAAALAVKSSIIPPIAEMPHSHPNHYAEVGTVLHGVGCTKMENPEKRLGMQESGKWGMVIWQKSSTQRGENGPQTPKCSWRLSEKKRLPHSHKTILQRTD